jgi:GTPase SAR1 family protein
VAPLLIIAANRWWSLARLRRRKYRLAVLGARYSGKTTLISSWRGVWIGDEADPGRTQAPRVYSKTKLTVEGLRLAFTNLVDVSGAIEAWPQWEDRLKESRYVLYLVDARALTGQLKDVRPRNWDRLEDDAGQVGSWLRENRVELCIVVVTHTDEDARLKELGPEDYREMLVAQLDPLMLRLGGPRKVRVVISSLKRRQDAERATSLIMHEIISWEQSK